ncbi:TPA: hypothetical protein DIC20_02375 [Candidatus Dependentiae bacterium]|nr:MAG: hypothetical protein US03_C0003G0032 [candidate division TM6 bacterium GW2011_GWF2_36_131]KKQ03351.1 MAG: hypothetical protein US13_C0003G0032 [candidate division TM6 bacterium GW2011_GWE2_36_25]KKQ19747.1 MAG: hypothetical protein US32_C0005G0031 [candidate division TM6 bacterium GW2011_GWA2_36_9]HBR70871.1 hypothetical protein [Candidatus Dependentiae bacterium]HCU00526.1 hypothetical protein [Candidatus Dependentiae bacterium]
MKKTFFFSSLLFFTSVFAMQNDVSCSEGYKRQYERGYADASRMMIPGRVGKLILGNFMAHEMRSGLCKEVLQPRLDAIQDVLDGKPNKFEK